MAVLGCVMLCRAVMCGVVLSGAVLCMCLCMAMAMAMGKGMGMGMCMGRDMEGGGAVAVD